MSTTRDTSHSPIISLCDPEQSPFGDRSRHASTAFLSSAVDCGEREEAAMLVPRTVVADINSNDPTDAVSCLPVITPKQCALVKINVRERLEMCNDVPIQVFDDISITIIKMFGGEDIKKQLSKFSNLPTPQPLLQMEKFLRGT